MTVIQSISRHGTPVTAAMSAEEMIDSAGLDYEVERVALFDADGVPIPGYRAIARLGDDMLTREVYGIASER